MGFCRPCCSEHPKNINRYWIRINNGHLLFPEHQNFWKSIKNPSQKVGKCKIFPKNFDVFLDFYVTHPYLYVALTLLIWRCVSYPFNVSSAESLLKSKTWNFRFWRKCFELFIITFLFIYQFPKFQKLKLVKSSCLPILFCSFWQKSTHKKFYRDWSHGDFF